MPATTATPQRSNAASAAGRTGDAPTRRRRRRAPEDTLSAACLAHELNQPLAGILLNAGTCLRLLDAQHLQLDGARQAARLIVRDVERCMRLIDAMRALFGRAERVRSSVALDATVHEVLALAASELAQAGVQVHYELSSDVPPLPSDPVLLQQVVLNLVRNAIQAMAPLDGQPRQLFIGTRWCASTNEATLCVRDSGPGIAPNDAARLFTPFFTTKPDGMGIGLSLARSFAEQHGGRIWATLNEGPGATFWLALPTGAAPAAAPGPSRPGCPTEPCGHHAGPRHAPGLEPGGGIP